MHARNVDPLPLFLVALCLWPTSSRPFPAWQVSARRRMRYEPLGE